MKTILLLFAQMTTGHFKNQHFPIGVFTTPEKAREWCQNHVVQNSAFQYLFFTLELRVDPDWYGMHHDFTGQVGEMKPLNIISDQVDELPFDRRNLVIAAKKTNKHPAKVNKIDKTFMEKLVEGGHELMTYQGELCFISNYSPDDTFPGSGKVEVEFESGGRKTIASKFLESADPAEHGLA